MKAGKRKYVSYHLTLSEHELMGLMAIMQEGIEGLKERIKHGYGIINIEDFKVIIPEWENNIKCLSTLIEQGR